MTTSSTRLSREQVMVGRAGRVAKRVGCSGKRTELVVSLRALFYTYGHNAEMKQELNGVEARVF